jgi:hypothetical protein
MTEETPHTSAGARHTDPITSHLAAQEVEQSRLERWTYDSMRPFWPRYMTSLEIAAAMGIDKWSVSPRLKPLWVKGWLDDPIKKAGINSSGKIRLLQHWRVKDITR